MKRLRNISAAALMMIVAGSNLTASAQDNVEVTVQADVVSQYIWRGQDCGDISVQPTLGVSYKGLSLTAWGSVGLSDETDTKEFDLTLAYSIAGFNIGITDYWFDAYESGARYFEYAAHETSHVFEVNVGYDFGPVAFQWYTNFAGGDGVNDDGDRAYSSYMELSAPFTFGGVDWNAAIGAVPYTTSYYAEAGGFAVTNVMLKASKDIKVTDKFSVPLFASINANPSSEKCYFVFGFSLKPW